MQICIVACCGKFIMSKALKFHDQKKANKFVYNTRWNEPTSNALLLSTI